MNAAVSKPLVLQFLGRSDLGVFRACRKYKHVGFVFAMYEITRKFAVMDSQFHRIPSLHPQPQCTHA